MTTAALIYGLDSHHLDHLAPLCHLLDIPLIVTEESLYRSATTFYPNLTVICLDYLTIPQYVVSHYSVIVCCLPRLLFDEVFFFAQKLARKKIHTIWCPHGNSDKGNQSPHIEALNQEETALIYGQQMIDFFKRKNVFNQLKAHHIVGNFRYQFYKDNLSFYDPLVYHRVFKSLPKKSCQLLYAPTWNDHENSSSFATAAFFLLEHLPEDWNLIIKPHPNLLIQEEALLQELQHRYQHHPRIVWVTDFPPIYPLLNQIDIYIGDMSSIGYDFLTFNRPLFFLNPNNRDPQTDLGLYLHRCGIQILPHQYAHIYQIIEDSMTPSSYDFSKIRTDVYNYAFASTTDLPIMSTTYELFPSTPF